ncbi:MAG: hypothetical protein AB7O56_03890 [Bauldia sp.]
MRKLAGIIAGAGLSLTVVGAALAQQEPGRVGGGPPEDFTIEVAFAADRTMTVSQTEIRLAQGGYYRLNLICPSGVVNEAGVTFQAPEFLQNMHIRIVSVSELNGGFQDVNEINFHMQGLNLRQIDCEGLGMAARISFHPMRTGEFPFTIIDDTVQPNVEVTGVFIVE